LFAKMLLEQFGGPNGELAATMRCFTQGLPRRVRARREAQLEALATELERTHPGAAGSLCEGLAATLTVLRLGVSPTLARTLHRARRACHH